MVNTNLINIDYENCSENDRNILFEQYKIYLENIEKVSDRRNLANGLFMTVNTILISVIGLSFQSDKLLRME